MRRISKLTIFCVIIIYFCVACNPNRPISTKGNWDGGFLSAEPCSPPCFYGLEIGISKDAEVSRLINSTLANIINCGVNINIENNTKFYQCKDFSLFMSKGILEQIDITFHSSLKLSNVIDKYGHPDRVRVIPSPLPDSPSTSTLFLIYVDENFVLLFPTIDGAYYPVDENTSVLGVTYGYSMSSLDYSWRGYGEYFYKGD